MTGRTRSSGFWSDRKARVQAEALAEEQDVLARAAEAEQAAQDTKTDEELLEEFGLPDPDSLELGDDIRGFMSKAVPDRLRRRALRQLWRMNPVLANVDGLVDYGQDFTDSAMVVENLQTAYQVGKGMLSHVQEMARQAEEKLAKIEAAEAGSTDAAEEVSVTEGAAEQELALQEQCDASVDAPEAFFESTIDPEPVSQGDVEVQVEMPRRRMRFQYTKPNRSEAAA